MLFGVVGVFISFGIISAGWCTWTTSLLCGIYMLHRFVLPFLEALEHLYFVWFLFQSLGQYEDIAFEETVRRLYSLLSFVVRIPLSL